MTGAQQRLSTAIARLGETITLASGTTTGIVTLIHPEAARKFLTDAEVGSASRPIYAIAVTHDDDSLDTTSITVNGKTLTVIRVVERRLRGVTLYKLALAS